MRLMSPSRAKQLGEAVKDVHYIKPGEKLARITIKASGARLDCLIDHCSFWVGVPQASRAVMEHELKQFFRDHRSHRHFEYEGRSVFEFVLDQEWPRHAERTETPCTQPPTGETDSH